MDRTHEQRAAERRATWRSGRVKLAHAGEADRLFWAEASDDARLCAIWELALEVYVETNEVVPGLRGAAGGVRRR